MTIESPCSGVCTLTIDGALCTGCGRTIAEIANWATADAPERAAIIAKLPARLLQFGDSGKT